MRIYFRERDVKVRQTLRAQIERRLVFALSRFGDSIGRVSVRFSKTIERGGEPHIRCVIGLSLLWSKSIRVQDMDSDPLAAANHATDRLARSVARALDQMRSSQSTMSVADGSTSWIVAVPKHRSGIARSAPDRHRPRSVRGSARSPTK